MNDVCVSSRSDAVAAAAVAAAAAGAATDCVSASYGRPCSSRRICLCLCHCLCFSLSLRVCVCLSLSLSLQLRLHITCCSCDSSPVSTRTRCEAMSCSVCQYLYFCTSKTSKLSTTTGCAILRPCHARTSSLTVIGAILEAWHQASLAVLSPAAGLGHFVPARRFQRCLVRQR